MKHHLFLCLLFPSLLLAQKFEYGYALRNNAGDYSSQRLAFDSEGNRFTAANFSGTVDVSPGPEEYLIESEHLDFFVCKNDPAGNLIWTKTVSGEFSQEISAIALTSGGEILLLGSTNCDSTDLDPGEGVSMCYGLRSFLVKLDNGGNFLWERNWEKYIGGIYHMGIDPWGNIVLGGTFWSPFDVDPGAGVYEIASVENPATNNSTADALVVKLSPDGDFIWVRNFGGMGNEDFRAMCLDDAGNIYSSGTMYTAIDADPSEEVFMLTPTPGFSDFYVQKLDKNGQFIWARNVAGQDHCAISVLACSPEGDVYAGGKFSGEVDLSAGQGNGIVSAEFSGLFMMKLMANGSFAWAKKIPAAPSFTNTDTEGLVYSGEGKCYISGTFSPDIPSPPVQPKDIFVKSISSAGELLWEKAIVGKGKREHSRVTLDNEAGIIITGKFTDSTDLDPSGQEFIVTAAPGSQFFVTRWTEEQIASEIVSQGVFPNPFTEKITVNAFPGQQTEVTVLDLTGKPVYRTALGSTGAREIYPGELRQGIYLVYLKSANGEEYLGRVLKL